MKIEAGEFRFRERFGHDNGRRSVPTADICDLRSRFQFCVDAIERREPVLDEVGGVARAEELFRPAKQTVMMLLPSQPRARAKSLRHSRFVVIDRRGGVKPSGHGDRAFRIREDRLLLLAHRKTAALRLVIDIARRSLVSQPLAHVSRIKPSALGQCRGIRRPDFSQSPVKAQAVAEDNQRAAHNCTQVSDQFPNQILQRSFGDLRLLFFHLCHRV